MISIKYSKLALALPLALGLGACQKEFDAINQNPNNPEVVDPAFVLTNAHRQNITRLFDIPANMDGGLLIVQHWAKVQYTNEDRYAFRPGSYQSIWDGFYSQGLQDYTDIVRQGVEKKNPNYQAVGIIMRSYFFSVLTDIYGDIPYSEALRLQSNIITPKYDKQQDVYRGLIAELKTASDLIDPSAGSVGGDIVYDGDMVLWKKFANSLRLRLAMRSADADEAAAKTVVAEILNANVLIASNSENAQLNFLTSQPNNNPINQNFKNRDDHRVSRSITKRLNALADPRLPVYAEHPESGDSVAFYRGVQNGLTSAQAAALGPLTTTSKIGEYFRAATAPGVLMTYSEVLFFKAEAQARGFFGAAGDAAATYKSAIGASWNQYGIATGAALDAYVAKSSVAYNPANFKKSIGEQKWIALFGQGIEAWSEFRRLDYPKLKLAAAPDNAAGGKFPVRFLYPATEQSINQANYTAAVANQGADALTTKLWWDKFDYVP